MIKKPNKQTICETQSIVWLLCEDQSLFLPFYGDSETLAKRKKASDEGGFSLRARNEIRTRDPNLGKVVLYH